MDYRKCKTCEIEKSIDNFAVKDKKKGRVDVHCRACAYIKYQVKYNKKPCSESVQATRNKIIDNKILLEQGLKRCTHCKNVKPLSYFIKNKSNKDKLSYYCAVCYREKFGKKRRKRTKEEHRKEALKKRFGMTLEDYDNMSISQNHLCAICCQPETNGKMLSIDHCHNSNKIRGLLCNRCNLGIGMLSDNIEILQKAIEYLEKYKNKE